MTFMPPKHGTIALDIDGIRMLAAQLKASAEGLARAAHAGDAPMASIAALTADTANLTAVLAETMIRHNGLLGQLVQKASHDGEQMHAGTARALLESLRWDDSAP
jgi:hypothetical protein